MAYEPPPHGKNSRCSKMIPTITPHCKHVKNRSKDKIQEEVEDGTEFIDNEADPEEC